LQLGAWQLQFGHEMVLSGAIDTGAIEICATCIDVLYYRGLSDRTFGSPIAEF
jgi:hypothetical protein